MLLMLLLQLKNCSSDVIKVDRGPCLPELEGPQPQAPL